MFKKIFQLAITETLNNTTLVRVAFVTTFFHTLVNWVWIGSNINTFVIEVRDVQSIPSLEIWTDLLGRLFSAGWTWQIALIGAFVYLAYATLYPLGTATMVFFLKNKKLNGSIAKAFSRYFPLVITMAWVAAFTLSPSLVGLFSRFFILDIAQYAIVKIIMLIFIMIIAVATFLTPYADYAAILSTQWWSADDQARKSIRFSAKLAIGNIWLTIQYLFINALLQFRFFLWQIFVIWIPLLVMILITELWLINQADAPLIMYWGIAFLFLILMYINALVEAFFVSYWYYLYDTLIKRLKSDEWEEWDEI